MTTLLLPSFDFFARYCTQQRTQLLSMKILLVLWRQDVSGMESCILIQSHSNRCSSSNLIECSNHFEIDHLTALFYIAIS